uniref:Ribonuclease H-like domain-containing protein n=1 Tax=Tanacetum cinerariifolium TaxID=118510 RepID=A0A6L2J6D9_TANCI|nr:ribonuclease H-like domain-containing protein [Tanacetum cinerariifolium]
MNLLLQKEKLDRKNEMKARGTLLMALPNKDQLKFHSYQDAKLLMEAIEKRLQKLISQLEIQGEVIKQEDMNLNLLRSLSSEWKTHALIWRNKTSIETISLDDLYNNLKIYKPELTGSSSTSQNPQNMAFVSFNSTNSTSSTNEADNTSSGVSIAHTKGSSSSSDFEVDSYSRTCIKAYATLKEQYDSLSLDYKKSQFNLVSYKAGLQSVEERLAHYKKNKVVYEEKNNILNLEVKLRDNALVENTKKLEKAKKRDELKLTLEKFQNSSKSLNNLLENQVSDKVKTGLRYKVASLAVESFVNSSKMLENQENVKSRSNKGYHVVPPPYTRNYIPPKYDLMFIDKQVESDSVDVVSNVASSDVKTVESKHESVDVKNKGVYNTIETKPVRKNSFSPSIIEDWNYDDESEVEFVPKVEVKTVRPSIEKINFVKSAREKVEKVETPKQHKHYPRGNQRNWNNLMSQRLGSKLKTVGSSVNTVRSVNTADSKPIMNYFRLISNAYKTRHLQVIRPYNKATHSRRSTEYKEKGVIDSGCSRHMIRNKFYLTDYEDYDGGFVSFEDGKGRISGKRKNRTLIEAARTMLVDSKLPTTFWAEAVNTACYVLNRALVIKPHNKTPYELIYGRPPLIDFMKPFGRPVTILNTRDHLGKFDRKVDEGFFFQVLCGKQTKGIAGTKDNIVTGQAKKKKEPKQEYILIPICTTDPLISQGPKDSAVDARKKETEVDESRISNNGGQDDLVTRSEFERLLQQERQTKHIYSTNSFNTVSSSVSTAGPSFVNTSSPSLINVARTPACTNAFEEHSFK